MMPAGDIRSWTVERSLTVQVSPAIGVVPEGVTMTSGYTAMSPIWTSGSELLTGGLPGMGGLGGW